MPREHHHPAERSTRPLTEPQLSLLRRVVTTNGGGLSVYAEPDAVIRALVNRHLIHGKPGSPGRFVHTRLGLETVRTATPPTTPPTGGRETEGA